MEKIRDFKELVAQLASRKEKSRVAVVWPADECTRGAVALALEAGFVAPIFVGCRAEVEADERLMKHADMIQFIEATDGDDAAAKAVALVREGGADVLMKGMLNTDNLLRAVLNKEHGILPKGNVLTHITAGQLPSYHKLLLFTDVAVIPYPTPEQRHAQVEYLKGLTAKLGIECPRIALIHCSEKVDERHFPFTADYKELSERSARGELGNVIVDGPMDVKVACSVAAMRKKHLNSPIMGEADAVIFPDIEAGNTFYKTVTLFAGASVAGTILGAQVPIVLPSRGDSEESKLYSLAISAL